MLKKLTLLYAGLLLAITPAMAAPEIGAPAPDFTAIDINGEEFKLSDHKDTVVVLEWTNNQCPFVIKHYDTGNMQKTQKTAREMGFTWVSIVSSAPGRQGHTTAEEAKAIAEKAGATITTKILDESGEIGNLYEAATTPHMFIIDKMGNLAYAGAIDSISSPRHNTVEKATNYVLAALNDLVKGKSVAIASTQPYGCSVKYAY